MCLIRDSKRKGDKPWGVRQELHIPFRTKEKAIIVFSGNNSW